MGKTNAVLLFLGALIGCVVSQQVTGSQQLISAINAALAIMGENGEWWTVSQRYAMESGQVFDEYYYFIETYYPMSQYQPFPTNATGKLARILENKLVTVTQINTQIPVRRVEASDMPSGKDAMLHTIMQHIAQHYGVTDGIAIEYHAYMPPSNDWNLYRTTLGPRSTREDLADAIMSIGGLYTDPITKISKLRTDGFLHSYPVLSNFFVAWVHKHSQWFTADQLKTAIVNGANITVCINGNNGNIATTTFNGPNIRLVKFTSNVEAQCTTKLIDGEVDVFFSEYPPKRADWLSHIKAVRFNKLSPTAYFTADV
jgi:hypothetical protein